MKVRREVVDTEILRLDFQRRFQLSGTVGRQTAGVEIDCAQKHGE